ncbi:amidohydrolase family protein [Nordella sp. HKS 07]|uniref:amidohydrolase family protein n=1 Tax=Nordella sp. HKS 07 TaxID=2712222 RepID=UPI0013E1D014|nr:amidohydrolase family protein [Nordella sp. HKS 07]QIG50451.1 amidohydrolase family protein [Nordella sp. HKS 07]
MSDLLKVDMHIHVYPNVETGVREKAYEVWEYGRLDGVRYSECTGTHAEISDSMCRAGFSKAVLLIYFKGESRLRELEENQRREGREIDEPEIARLKGVVEQELVELNRWGCSIAKSDERISTFITIDVGIQSPEGAAEMVVELARREGAKGLKLHSALQGFSMSDRRLWPVYTVCQEMGLPVLGHAGPDKGGKGLSDPNAFAEMLGAFPKLKVVVAHMGGAAWRQTLDIARKYENAVFDCSEIIHWTGAPNAPSDYELARLIKDVGPERVMLGSDFPWYDLDTTIERFFALPVLSDDEKMAIAGANAVRILRL